MKLLIFSDIHGSNFYAKKIDEIYERENPDKIVLLGDLYYHGPRNPLTEEYNPIKVSEILNKYKDSIWAIKGNCDSEVDELISEFKFNDHIFKDVNGKKIYFTHGHKFNIDNLPDEEIDILIYGHFHTGFIKEKDNIIFVNPGSISLPKDNTKNSYLILNENCIILKDLDGNVIDRKSI